MAGAAAALGPMLGSLGSGAASAASAAAPVAEKMGMGALKAAPGIFGQMEAARGRPGGAMLGALGSGAMQGLGQGGSGGQSGQAAMTGMAPAFLQSMAKKNPNMDLEEWMKLQSQMRNMMG